MSGNFPQEHDLDSIPCPKQAGQFINSGLWDTTD